jgi:septation ring formation regulator EzrA
MAKKKKEDTIQDIMDRIEEDMSALRDKVDELENQEDDSDDDSDE